MATKQSTLVARGPTGGLRLAARLGGLATLFVAIALARASSANVVLGVNIEGSGANRTVRIQTTAEPTFTVFRLSDPMRVVVDISGGDLSQLEGPIAVEDGVVDQIATRQFTADGFMIARLIVGFAGDFVYDVQGEGRAVVIRTGAGPEATVDKAVLPPVEPVDRGEAERLERARREAEEAAARAIHERKQAEKAARRAVEQRKEADRIASEAERLRREAERARTEAVALRDKAEAAVAKERAAAEAAAREAEARRTHIENEAHQVARSRAEAERLAARAESARRDAEEMAANATALHKSRVAEIEELAAQAEQEKRAAEKAWKRARAAKQEAEEAQRLALAATRQAKQTRRATASKLSEIAERERAIDARINKLERARQLTAAERTKLADERRQAEARVREAESEQRKLAEERRRAEKERLEADEARRRAEDERRELEQARELAQQQLKKSQADRLTVERERRELGTQRLALDKREAALAQRAASLQKQHARISDDRRALVQLQEKLDEAQAKLEEDRRALGRAEQEHGNAVKRQRVASSTSAKRESARLRSERKKLEEERARIDRAQREIQKERRRLAGARDKLQAAERESQALENERRALAREKGKLEEQRKTLVAREAQLRSVGRRSKKTFTTASLIEPQQQQVTLASAAVPVARTPAREHATLKGVERRGSGNAAGVLLRLDRRVPYETQRLASPPRLVLDLADTRRGTSNVTYGISSPFIRRVRLGDHGSVVRAVFDLTTDHSKHEIVETSEGLLVRIEAPPPTRVTKSPASLPSSNKVADVRFAGEGRVARVILDVSDDVKARVDDRSQKAWVLELSGAHVGKPLERSLDTTAYGTVVRLVSTYQASQNPPVVNVVANLRGRATYDLKRENGSLIWEIKSLPTVAASDPQTAGFAAEAQVLAQSTAKQTRKKAKKRINIDLKDADIVNVLRLLAEVSGENIIASDDVKGNVTLKLRNVPWDQALDTILKTKGYDKVRHHNILRIAPAERIRKEKEEELATKRAREQVEDTVIRMVTVNYAISSDIVGQLKPLLTGRGTVQTDERTNTLIIEDVKSNIRRLVELTKRLDKQTPQVLIEARIVEASSNNLEELGIQWGGIGQATAATGNPTGLSFPGDVSVAGTIDQPNYAVNLPAKIGEEGAGIGFIFGSAGGSQVLNLRLTALEQEGKGRIISSPRITTLDNRTAKIAQGVDIPITVVSAAGANTRFIPANLELEVTPHVTNDGSVLMKIITTKNEPDFANTGALGDPTIVKKYAETEVLVRDGDTTVIGGIYTRNVSESYSKVPLLGDIPIIGWLFKTRRSEDTRAELLVFITPRIINRQESIMEGTALPGGVE